MSEGVGPGQSETRSAAVPRPRIQGLSDLIFGLALSISALTLVGEQPTTTEQLAFALGLYAFSFLILISVWRIYSSITSILPSETSLLVDLNIILLFFVSIEPYLFNELFALGGSMYSSVSGIYGTDLAAMFFILAFFTHMLVDEEKHLIPQDLLGRYRGERNMTLLVALVFALSVVPYFGSAVVLATHSGGAEYEFTLRSVLWIACLIIGWSRRLVVKAGRREARRT